MIGSTNQREESRFNRSAWLVLGFALALILVSTAQMVYRYTLPTDGWSVYASEIEQAGLVYLSNGLWMVVEEAPAL